MTVSTLNFTRSKVFRQTLFFKGAALHFFVDLPSDIVHEIKVLVLKVSNRGITGPICLPALHQHQG